MPTHYETLGLASTATTEQIKAAYRAVAVKDHPDRNADPKASERFIAASQAYEVLGDVDRRAHYDRELMAQRERRIKPRKVGEQDERLVKTSTDLGQQLGKLLDRKVPGAGGVGEALGGKVGESIGAALSDLLTRRKDD